MASKQKQSQRRFNTPEILSETVGTMTKSVGQELTNESRKFGEGFFKQLLGMENNQAVPSGMISPEQPGQTQNNVIFHAEKHRNNNQERFASKPRSQDRLAPSIYYHEGVTKNGEQASRRETRDITQKLEQITTELKRLVQTSKVLQMQFVDVAVEQKPTNVGTYHINYFEFLLEVISEARKTAEDAGTWLNAAKGKGKKGRWGNKDRKDWFGNTSRSLSSESVVANQVG
jgi:hypothetical protein